MAKNERIFEIFEGVSYLASKWTQVVKRLEV